MGAEVIGQPADNRLREIPVVAGRAWVMNCAGRPAHSNGMTEVCAVYAATADGKSPESVNAAHRAGRYNDPY